MAVPLRPQPWPWLDRPRVLLEEPNAAVGLARAAALRQAGFSVAVCPGPAVPENCPLAHLSEDCASVHGADVVVTSLGLDTEEGRTVLLALRRRYPGTPLVVELQDRERGLYAELLRDCELLDAPAEPERVVEAVGALLA